MCCHHMGAQKHKDCSLKRKCYIENANHKKRKKKQKKIIAHQENHHEYLVKQKYQWMQGLFSRFQGFVGNLIN